MTIEVEPLTRHIGGRMTGIDVRKPLTPEEVKAIDAGMDKHAVLVLPGQDITDEQQLAFTANFGPFQDGANSTERKQELRLDPAFADVSNLDRTGQKLARDDRRRIASLGNRLWHSDASFRVVSANYSILSGRIVVTRGGNTEFADMRAAYDALDLATKAEVEDMICEHSLIFSRAQLGFEAYKPEELAGMTPVRHRLVRTHPTSRRRSLFLSAHIGTILSWPQPEAMAFIRDLTEHATQEQFVYSHRWTQHDLVIWDNRTTMHRVRRYDDLGTVRDLRRTTTKGDGPTAEQVGSSPLGGFRRGEMPASARAEGA